MPIPDSATAVAYANIAFIKFWGERDSALHLPANGSLSMNLDGLFARTTVRFDSTLAGDALALNSRPAEGAALLRVSQMLERVRALAGITAPAAVESSNNFPMGAGIASSAAAFAALALAASGAAGLALSEAQLSRLARTGSGSACRSIPGGFVEWQVGQGEADSFAYSIAGPEHWRLVDCVALVSKAHKETGSAKGHTLAGSSPLQNARVADAPRRLELCRAAILQRDFAAFADLVELDSNLMHAVMMTSTPALLYWQPGTLAVMQAVRDWRRGGLPVCYTIDAGPNVHVLCPAEAAPQVQRQLAEIPGVLDVLAAHPGGPAHLE